MTTTPRAVQSTYESAATMRRSMALLQAEMIEFQVASSTPRDEVAMERARAAAHAYLDAYLDAISTGMVRAGER